MYNFRFGAGKDFKLQLERLAEVLGIENSAKNMAEVLGRTLERQRRREESAVESPSAATQTRPHEIVVRESTTSRHVPVAARDRVFERAGHQCQLTGTDGTRCTARAGLQMEHERPFAMYHSHDERYLSAHCARHNHLRAEQAHGAESIQARIEAGAWGKKCTRALATTLSPRPFDAKETGVRNPLRLRKPLPTWGRATAGLPQVDPLLTFKAISWKTASMVSRPRKKRSKHRVSDPSRKLLLACEMFDFGVALMTENLRRSHPEVSDAALQQKLKRWLQTRPGAAFGDCPGRPRSLSPSP